MGPSLLLHRKYRKKGADGNMEAKAANVLPTWPDYGESPTRYGVCSLHPQIALTRDELEVLAMMARDLTREEMAVEMEVSTGLIRNYYHAIFLKLGVSGRGDAVCSAVKMGILAATDEEEL